MYLSIERRKDMKRQFFTLLTTGVLSIALAAGAFAASPAADFDKDKVVSQLERRAQRLEWQAQATKGAGRQELELQRFHMKKLIERLKAGEAVDPQEIDMLLKKGPQ
jgi:hypothetical protein